MSISKATRVLQLGKYYPPYRGGIETHLELLSRMLRSRVDLAVVVANDRPKRTRDVVDGVRVERLARLFALAGTPVCPAMASTISRMKPDLVHVHLPNPTAVVSFLASRHQGPLVASWHSDVVRQSRLATLFQPIIEAFLRRCSAIIVASPNYLESSPALRGWRDKCHIIPYGIPVDAFQQSDPKKVRVIRERFGPRIVLTVARLVSYKGLKFLIRAMRDIRGKLLVVGDGPLRQTLEDEARNQGLTDRVVFLGSVPDTVPYYQACDVFVLPSVGRNEAFGIVQLEALAAGKPVVNTLLHSGVPFASPHGVTGFSVAPADSRAIAGAVNELLERPDLRSRFGNEGLRRVNCEFSLDKMVDRTMLLYEHVMQGSAAILSEQSRRHWQSLPSSPAQASASQTMSRADDRPLLDSPSGGGLETRQ